MRLALILIVVAGLAAAHPAAGDHYVRGVVTDESGAVLPGVTVVAFSDDKKVLQTVVTDGAGRYELGPFAGARVRVVFQLEGFAPVVVQAPIADADAIANQKLAIAPQSETVQVVGKIPVPPTPPPPPPPAPIRTRPIALAVPDHDHDSVCGPAKLESPPESLGTVHSRSYAGNGLYGAGDELTIEGGARIGLRVGRNLVVRRTFETARDSRAPLGEHTAGLVQIVASNLDSSVALVIYACDEMRPGDRLAPFQPAPRQPPPAAGKPDYRRAAKILFSDAGQLVGAPRRMMVIDQGEASGVCAGQRVTLFRKRAGDGARFIVGDAVVVAVRRQSATIRVEHARDAIFDDDLAAIER